MVSRDQVVIATKVHGRMRPGPNGYGLSRKAIPEIDHSLPGSEPPTSTSIGSTAGTPNPDRRDLEACTTWCKSGKVRYIGATSM